MKNRLWHLREFNQGALLLGCVCIGFAQKLPPPTRVWSVGPLTKSPTTMGITFGSGGAALTAARADFQTGSIFAATRSVVFASDRVVLASMVGVQKTELIYQVVSLDVRTGEVKDTREVSAFGPLKVFATNDAHVIVSGRSVMRLTPELKDAGTFGVGPHWRVENISPDGSTLGNATGPGFELVDARTLQTKELSDDTVTDTSVSSKAAVSDDLLWRRDYPKAMSFVTLTDDKGRHLIFHGDCGGRPEFLTDDRVLTASCKIARILDTRGNILKTMTFRDRVAFAGVSQDGRRFALQLAGKRERFIVYALDTVAPVAELAADQPPQEQSWSALSPDGKMIVVGSPAKLTLYRLP